jgi:putative SOS response-associated peptidase YedK
VASCTIITMPAGEQMTELYDRQPAILAPEAYDAWLDPATPAADVDMSMIERLL